MAVVTIPYGLKRIDVSVPDANYVETVSPRSKQPTEDEVVAVETALDRPIGSARLEEIARPEHRVAIVVDDYTRPTPVARILPSVLERLHHAGIPEDKITIVFALGTHRAMTDDEVIAKIGCGPAGRYRVVNSSVHDDADYAFVGASAMGIPVWMLEAVVSANLRVGIGSIVPHCDVGYSGGGKILLPGVCSAQTVAVNHTKGLDFRGQNLLGALTTIIREDIEEVVSRIGLHFIANAITTGVGATGRSPLLHALVCGDYIRAHRAGIPFAQDVYGVPTRQRVDITICSSHPGDVDFIQVAKSIWSGDKMTLPGGDLIVVTPCIEGIGPYVTLPSLMAQDRHVLERRIRNGEIEADTTGVMAALAVRLNRIGERVRISMVTEGLPPSVAKEMGIPLYASVEHALSDALLRQGAEASVSVMTHGGYTFPMVAGESQT